MLSIAEKEIMRRMARLAILEEDLIEREMDQYKKIAYQERPRDDLGRWLPKDQRTSYEEMEEGSQSESIRKIKVVRDKEKPHSYHVKDTGFSREDFKSLLAVIGVLTTFIYLAIT